MVKRMVLAAALGIALVVATFSSAEAEMLCGDREQIVAELKNTWHEDRIATAVTASGTLFEFFTSEEQTWTLLVTYPEGTAVCMLSAGEFWVQHDIEAVVYTAGMLPAEEARLAMGLTNNRYVLELYISQAGTWTLLLTSMYGGPSEAYASGTGWEFDRQLIDGQKI